MSDALRALAHRYREQPGGTPGTRDPRATGSVPDMPEPEDSQGVAGHGTPRTPGTPDNSNVRHEETDQWGLTAPDRAAATFRLNGTAPPLRAPGEPKRRRRDATQAAMVAGLLLLPPVVGRLAGPMLRRFPRVDASARVAKGSGGGASARRPTAGAARSAIRRTICPLMQ
jgi:hypothetical protein